MNPWRLCNEQGEKLDAWICSQCQTIHSAKYAPVALENQKLTPNARLEYARKTAERCCNHRCELCGEEAFADWQSLCKKHFSEHRCKLDRIKEQNRFEKAQKLTELPLNYHGVLYINDKYYFDGIEDAVQSIVESGGDSPEYLWFTKEELLSSMDIKDKVCDHIQDNMHERAYEQISQDQWNELKSFFKKWADATNIKSYVPDYSRCIIINESNDTCIEKL